MKPAKQESEEAVKAAPTVVVQTKTNTEAGVWKLIGAVAMFGGCGTTCGVGIPKGSGDIIVGGLVAMLAGLVMFMVGRFKE